VNRKRLNLVVVTLFLTLGVLWLYPIQASSRYANQTGNQTGICDSAYPGVCIESPPPDLNCPDVPDNNFRVLSPDPHRFDLEGDGVGCESED
jgi:hypothetical protein